MTRAFLSIALVSCLVNVGWGATLADLIQKARAEGRTGSCGSQTGQGDPGQRTTCQNLLVKLEASSDGLAHGFSVPVDTATYRFLLFASFHPEADAYSGKKFRTSLTGDLQSVSIVKTRSNKDGKPSSETTEWLDARSRAVKKEFRHELDFWLKGKYRKPQAKKK